jgi:hypothetical protein
MLTGGEMMDGAGGLRLGTWDIVPGWCEGAPLALAEGGHLSGHRHHRHGGASRRLVKRICKMASRGVCSGIILSDYRVL